MTRDEEADDSLAANPPFAETEKAVS